MLARNRFYLCGLVMLFLSSWRTAGQSPGGGEAAKTKSATDLQTLLEAKGYVGIPFQRQKVGHIAVEARVNGKRILLLIDTGATRAHLNEDRTKHLGLKWQGYQGEGRQRHGEKWAFCWIDDLEIGSVKTGPMFIWNDELTADANKTYVQDGDPLLDGILGDNILAAHQAVIDYAGGKLYLHPVAKQISPYVKSSPAPAPIEKLTLVRVGFWNLTGRDVTLHVAGKSLTLPKNREVRLDLERQFTWGFDGAARRLVRVTDGEAEHEVVIED